MSVRHHSKEETEVSYFAESQAPNAKSMVERLFSRIIVRPDDCWEWTGRKDEKGYGEFSTGSKVQTKKTGHASRFVYEFCGSVIPDGMELDHLCRNRLCVNPEHLEPVTHQENIARSIPFRLVRTHCKRGHLYTEQTTRKKINGRECLICAREMNKKRKQKYKEKNSVACGDHSSSNP